MNPRPVVVWMFAGTKTTTMCEFQSLYAGEEGYIVRCRQCRHYQIAFLSTLLTVDDTDFRILRNIVVAQAASADKEPARNIKSVAICTPAQNIWLLLTPPELERFHGILDEADTEERALSLMELIGSA